MPGVELRIADDEGRDLPAGTPGEVLIKTDTLMLGYWRNEEATRGVIRDGWLHSGDVGYLDADGFLYLVGRKKDLIIKGGENIAPREIEEALYEHPAVAEAAAVGVPHPRLGEDIWAAVQLAPRRAGRGRGAQDPPLDPPDQVQAADPDRDPRRDAEERHREDPEARGEGDLRARAKRASTRRRAPSTYG